MITLHSELSFTTDETGRMFSSTNLTLKQGIVFNCYLRDHQIVLAYTNR